MVFIPGAIILVNNDLTPGVEGPLERQLYIDEAITGTEFMARVAADPNYPQEVHGNILRILVIEDFNDGYYAYIRSLVDVVIFIKSGLASIEKNMFDSCPTPGETFDIDTLTMNQLLKRYPIHGTHHRPDNVQDNILYRPLYPHEHDWFHADLYPFGSGRGFRRGGRGADILVPSNKSCLDDDDSDE